MNKGRCFGRGVTALAVSFIASSASGQLAYEYQQAVPSDSVLGGSYGGAVGVSGTTGIVGAHANRNNGVVTGAAYIVDMVTGEQLMKLVASDGAGQDQFGYSVAISGTTAIVGAHLDDDAGARSGSAYVFELNSGVELFKLVGDDLTVDSRFGSSVAISGTMAIVGAHRHHDGTAETGSAYVFDTTNGELLYQLSASDIGAGDQFGTSVAISGTIAIVGSPKNDSVNGVDSGAAYLFDLTTGEQIHKIVGENAKAGSQFGTAVAISDSRAVVMGSTVTPNQVRAQVFDTTTGEQTLQFGGPGDLLRTSVAMSENRAIVGRSGFNDFIFEAGSAVVFDVATGEQISLLRASDAGVRDQLGFAVGISNENILVGANLDDGTDVNSGSAYMYTLCPADFTHDGVHNVFDVSAFIAAFTAGEPSADLSPDNYSSTFNFFDVSAFLSAYFAGCP
tara:strand:- start:7989 stop:9335 length:1347 start_codon:yes stop_codon:yes gene_type:complete